MVHRAFFAVFGLLSVVIVFLQVTAIRLDLYFELPWLDIVMHILGGVWVSLGVFAFYTFFTLKRGKSPTRTAFLLMLLPSLLFVAVAWEVLEVITRLTDLHDIAYWPDTLSDIFFGISGGVLGAVGLISHYQLRG